MQHIGTKLVHGIYNLLYDEHVQSLKCYQLDAKRVEEDILLAQHLREKNRRAFNLFNSIIYLWKQQQTLKTNT